MMVKLFQYVGWTENKVPNTFTHVIQLISLLERWQQQSGNGPVTIVCRYGLITAPINFVRPFPRIIYSKIRLLVLCLQHQTLLGNFPIIVVTKLVKIDWHCVIFNSMQDSFRIVKFAFLLFKFLSLIFEPLTLQCCTRFFFYKKPIYKEHEAEIRPKFRHI